MKESRVRRVDNPPGRGCVISAFLVFQECAFPAQYQMYQAYSFKLFSRANMFFRAKRVFMCWHLFYVSGPFGPNQAFQ